MERKKIERKICFPSYCLNEKKMEGKKMRSM